MHYEIEQTKASEQLVVGDLKISSTTTEDQFHDVNKIDHVKIQMDAHHGIVRDEYLHEEGKTKLST